jgi:copper chaperone CopZ
MSCGNCANAIKRVLNEIDGVTSAEVSLAEKNALVTADFVDPAILVSAINELGYQASAKKH